MTYIKNTWVDQEVERPKTYDITNNSDGTITLIENFGIVTELGTPVNADNMNHIEDGIKDCDNRVSVLEQETANVDLSNVSETGLDKIKSIDEPDFSNKEQKSYNTVYVASEDGYIGGGVILESKSDETSLVTAIDCELLIDNSAIWHLKCQISSNLSGGLTVATAQQGNFFHRIYKGQQYKLYTSYTQGTLYYLLYSSLYFCPLKNAN